MAYGERTVSGDQRIGLGDQQRNLNDQINLQEQRLEYFMNHYLPKQEVLYRLPLNISISSFWQELLERRKAGANLLPLHNSLGKPYWYMLTPKMIAASERLSREVIIQEKRVDPYQMKMTSAMTSEMYFTSYVEGAKISIEEAMNFLSRGTPPENVLEQLIWNNRQAWEWMIRNLYRPINEESLHFLAYTLTDGMENAAEEYRQTDYHLIPAMQDESYQVPPAARIPALMYEYYRFMNDQNVHPLIKASVGAAFLLVTRPFPEGNERLSRMISSMVLLRSGYGYFSDISLSSVIAKETWPYYQNLCEIMREDNDGDLTYFMEYFLEMLVRALEQMKEQQRLDEEKLLQREQEMSRQPFQATQSTAQSTQGSLNVAPTITSMVPTEPGIESDNNAPPSVPGTDLIPDVEDPSWLLQQYPVIYKKIQINRNTSLDLETLIADMWLQKLQINGLNLNMKKKLQGILKIGGIRSIRLTAFITQWLASGQTVFTTQDYKEKLHASNSMAFGDFLLGKRNGLMKVLKREEYAIYEILTTLEPEEVSLSGNHDIQQNYITTCLESGIKSKCDLDYLYRIIKEFGEKEFTPSEISQLLLKPRRTVNGYLKRFYDMGLLRRRMDKKEYVYQIKESVLESIHRSLNESSTEQEIPVDGSKKAMMEEEQAERLRARLEQKHPARVDIEEGTSLVAVG